MCWGGGGTGHFRYGKKCPAMGKECEKCGGRNHLDKVCMKTQSAEKRTGYKGKKSQMNQVHGDSTKNEEEVVYDDYASTLVTTIASSNIHR